MKQFTKFAALVLLIALIITPINAFATSENTSVAGVRFVEPKDIFVARYTGNAGYLYVLDEINEQSSVILRFNLETTQLSRYTVTGNYSNLYAIQQSADEAKVFLLNDKGIYCADITSQLSGEVTLSQQYKYEYEPSSGDAALSAKNYAPTAKGLAIYSRDTNLFAAFIGEAGGTQRLCVLDFSNNEVTTLRFGNNPDAKRLVMNIDQSALYVAVNYAANEPSKLHSFNIRSGGNVGEDDEPINSVATNLVAECWQDGLNTRYTVSVLGNAAAVDIDCAAITSYNKSDDADKVLHYFALNTNDFKIYKYDVTVTGDDAKGRSITKVEEYALGTDRITHANVNGNVKVGGIADGDLSGDTQLCVCGGYPSDFVYAYDNANSVSEGVKLQNNELFIWLKRTDTIENNDNYAYVFYNGKYGFVEKTQIKNGESAYSISATAQTTIDTFVYALPYDQQSIDNKALPKNTKLTLTFSISLWGGNWYYATYEGGEGWINKGAVGNVKETRTIEFVKGIYRVNPSAGGVAEVYADGNGQTPLTIDNTAVTLNSGIRVSVLDDSQDYYRIQFDYQGQYYVGYVSKLQLIDKGMSAGEIVGISLLVVAAVIAAFLIIMSVRRKKHLAKKAKEGQEAEATPPTQ